jgi:hypothetical protein
MCPLILLEQTKVFFCFFFIYNSLKWPFIRIWFIRSLNHILETMNLLIKAFIDQSCVYKYRVYIRQAYKNNTHAYTFSLTLTKHENKWWNQKSQLNHATTMYINFCHFYNNKSKQKMKEFITVTRFKYRSLNDIYLPYKKFNTDKYSFTTKQSLVTVEKLIPCTQNHVLRSFVLKKSCTFATFSINFFF